MSITRTLAAAALALGLAGSTAGAATAPDAPIDGTRNGDAAQHVPAAKADQGDRVAGGYGHGYRKGYRHGYRKGYRGRGYGYRKGYRHGYRQGRRYHRRYYHKPRYPRGGYYYGGYGGGYIAGPGFGFYFGY